RIAERLAVLSLTPALQGDAGIERCLLRRLVPQADTPGALLHVFGLGQRRQPLWDVAEERVHLGAGLLLTAFDRLPVLLDLLHGRALLIAKDVRVAADDLGRNVGDDVAQRERA